MKSNFKKDFSFEKKIGDFLDTNFYDWLVDNEPGFESYRRIDNVQDQKKGKDVVVKLGSETSSDNSGYYNIDEKCASYYINEMLKTFAFELSYLNKGTENQGWLYDKNKETDIYALIWPNIHIKKYTKLLSTYKKDNALNKSKWFKDIKSTDFTLFEVWMVRRNKLIELLSDEFGLDEKRILEIRQQVRLSSRNPDPVNRNYSIQINNYLEEKPINIVLKKSAFRDIATRYIIYDGEVINLNRYEEMLRDRNNNIKNKING